MSSNVWKSAGALPEQVVDPVMNEPAMLTVPLRQRSLRRRRDAAKLIGVHAMSIFTLQARRDGG